jgi:hypothetical protein
MSHDGSDCLDDWASGKQNPNCHSDGDIGADFWIGGRGGANYFNTSWTVPTKDLSAIYREMMNITDQSSSQIYFCTTEMYIGAILERHFANLITFYFDHHTAFLTEDLDLWYHGGLEDMGA